jgi:7-cyano-7-deazaguanine synthase
MAQRTAALVLFSGGQDSTVCLAHALARYDTVETAGFIYGQRHAVELQARLEIRRQIPLLFPQWAARLGPDHLIDISSFGQIGETAMTRDIQIETAASGLPNTFVPGRNLIFLNYAAALGYRRGLTTLVGGMCETDFSGYPDCRHDTLQALAHAISLGMDRAFAIETPLMWLDKAAIWAKAHELGGEQLTRLIIEASHTCYLGVRDQLHAWGHGCGTCPACVLRKRGYETWQTGKN